MKKTLLLSLAATLSLSAWADYTGAGYYRVHNYKTSRYVSVIDNRGSIDLANTTADLQAIQLQKNFDEVCCDPASVLYIKPVGSEYQIETQGTGIYQIISHYLQLVSNGSSDGQTLYRAYGELNGVIKYLGDGELFPVDLGGMVTNAKNDYTKWFITPIDANASNFFGLRPTLTVAGKNYMTLYGSFPYTPYNDGIKSYYISKADNGMAVMTEITGTVPASTPVIVECPTANATTNRLNIGGSADAVPGNQMKGVYFNNPSKTHLNRVAYDKNTMRILGTCADGSLGFITSQTLDFIPKNTAYLSVPAGSPSEFKCVTQAEYDAYMASIPSAVTLSATTLELTEGDTSTLTATITPANPSDATLTWSSSNPAVATVANGVVTAVAPGSATITVSTYNGKTATCAVTVKQRVIQATGITLNPASYTCTEGESFTITATVLPDNASDKSVTWSTSDASVATVSNGVVNTLAAGAATITATTANGLTATCAVTVNKSVVNVMSITVTPDSFKGEEGDTFTLTATVLPEDATDSSVTWSSSNENVATVSSNGLLTITGEGSAVITATANDGSGVSGTCYVTGEAAGIESIIGEGKVSDVYDLMGRRVLTSATAEQIASLPAGLYVIAGKKVIIR